MALIKTTEARDGWHPWHLESQGRTLSTLGSSFRGDAEVNEPPERTRKRYIDAIYSVADYLEDIGADAVWVKRFDELNGAVEDLGLQPALTPQYRSLEGEK